MTKAITVENLSKQYRIGVSRAGGYRTLRESINDGFASLGKSLRRAGRASKSAPRTSGTHWALKDVSFDVRSGEVVGIIGRNGAGKSTLLKILSRITEPTSGRAEIRGRIGSLLEVGTGFHPELTGRENVYMNGSILGMSHREITRKFDEIVAFSEIEEFLDTPVKRYSSGMFVKLAFAVAAHLEPEILIIDEVLAVGDAKFQAKCLSKLDDVKRGGHTVLVVSHQMHVIQSICQRSILLDRGKIQKIGSTADVVATYLGSSRERTDLRHFRQEGTGEAKLLELRVTTASDDGCPREVIRGETLQVELSVLVKSELREANLSMALRNSDGLELFSHCWSDQFAELPTLRPGRHAVNLDIPTCCLRPGLYSLSLCVSKRVVDRVADVAGIELPPVVLESTANLTVEGRRWGVVYIECEWSHRYQGPDATNA